MILDDFAIHSRQSHQNEEIKLESPRRTYNIENEPALSSESGRVEKEVGVVTLESGDSQVT